MPINFFFLDSTLGKYGNHKERFWFWWKKERKKKRGEKSKWSIRTYILTSSKRLFCPSLVCAAASATCTGLSPGMSQVGNASLCWKAQVLCTELSPFWGRGVHSGQLGSTVDPRPPYQPLNSEDLPLSKPTRINIVLKRPSRWTWDYRTKISRVLLLPEYS